jgi:hypothetical protein
MPEKPSSNTNWWQTLPGMLTGVAAIITAVTGFLVAFNHMGARSGDPAPSSRSVPDVAPRGSAATSNGREQPVATAAQPIQLPAMNRVRLAGGTAVITILSAEIEPIDAQRRSLTVVVRYMNTDRYDANFWSASYRLIIDDVPRAPTNLLDEVVSGDSAKEGEIVFELPVSAKNVVLQVGARDDKARIPLALP